MWDAVVSSACYLFILPLLALIYNPIILLAYVIDTPLMLVPVLYGAVGRKEVRKALSSFPAFFVLRIVNAVFILEAVWTELVMRRPLLTYEKGH